MTTYHTRNPLGSTEPKDLFDNAENLDHRENDLENEEWEDRFGRSRLTWHGIEKRHERQQEKFNDDFQQFLLNSGYEDLGDYDEGLVLTSRNQVFRYDGELYRASAALELPYTTTGVWSEESTLFVSVGDGALRQQLSEADGGKFVGFMQPFQGAILRDVMKRMQHDSPLTARDFGAMGDGVSRTLGDEFASYGQAVAHYPFIANMGTPAEVMQFELDGVAIRAALEVATRPVGLNDGSFRFNSTLPIYGSGNPFGAGAILVGEGTYATDLLYTGTDVTRNAIEILSGRRDSGNANSTRAGHRVENLLLRMDESAVCNSFLWIEAGCFHYTVERMRALIQGRPARAVIELSSGGGTSYSVGPSFRDITITGQNNTLTGLPIPVGIWLAGVIEAIFDAVKVYSTEVGWRFGASNSMESRNVADTVLIRCHSEIGKGSARGNGTDAGVALQFFQGVNLQFYGCKSSCGADGGAGGQRVMTFNAAATQSRSIVFRDQYIWNIAGTSSTSNAIEVLAGARFYDIRFDHPTVNAPGGIISIADTADSVIQWDKPTYVSTNARRSRPKFNVRGVDFAAVTLADKTSATVDLPEFQLAYAEPFLASLTSYGSGCFVTAYKSSGHAQGVGCVINETAGDVNLSAGRFRWRAFDPDEIRAVRRTQWDPPSIASGGQQSTTVAVPEAQLGDFVVAAFGVTATGGLGQVLLSAYVSAPGYVTVLLTNFMSVARNFPLSDLAIYVLDHQFDMFNAVAYDPPNIASGNGVTTTVPVPGARKGDFVVASFSGDLQGLIMNAQVNDDDSVAVRIHNETGSAVDLASGTLSVGVYKRHNSL